VTGLIVRLLRLASFVICLIVLASFVIFATGQTKAASKHQTEAVTGTVNSSPSSSKETTAHESSLHKDIDEASEELTSPFAGVVSGSSSEWVIRGVKLLLALAVYGFGLSYLARVLRVRV
jgi:hypothetical protein